MTEHEAATGDALREMIGRAVRALMDKDPAAAWQALDNAQAARTLREWDRLRGREVPSEAEVQAGHDKLVALLRQAVSRGQNAPMPTSDMKPGRYLYFADIPGCDPCPVEIRDTGECGLGVFFEGRDDYDLLEEVSGRFEPVTG